ncbi:MAG: AraC family transcriptional regulator [Saprospiraceae bacterium]|nr:AraC family transcriptional regulator [Saprospiraceae bacterium]
MKIHIKYMLSARCQSAAKLVCRQRGLHFIMLGHGEMELMETLNDARRTEFKTALSEVGLELMDETEVILIQKIKKTIQQVVLHPEILTQEAFPSYLSKKLKCDYAYMANLFSEVSGATIEQYFVTVELEWIKEMIIYCALSLPEIAQKMKYSSVTHLSNQFKKVAGLSSIHFKALKDQRKFLIAETSRLGRKSTQ